MLQQRQPHHDVGHPLSARGVSDLLHVLNEARDIKEFRNRSHLLAFLINHHCRSDTAVWMTATRNLTPFCLRAVYQIREIGKRSHQRQREPITSWFGDTDLTLHIVREVRQRIALLQSSLFGNFSVTASK